jgi:hypothetical protein
MLVPKGLPEQIYSSLNSTSIRQSITSVHFLLEERSRYDWCKPPMGQIAVAGWGLRAADGGSSAGMSLDISS